MEECVDYREGQLPYWDDVASPWKLKHKTILASPYLFCHIHLSIKERDPFQVSPKLSESITISCFSRCFVLITYTFFQPFLNAEKLVKLKIERSVLM